MHKFFTSIVVVLLSLNIQAQNSLNMELLSNLQYNQALSDIWGYAAPDGREYAIVGTRNTTSIVDLLDPRNPVEVASITGAPSTWRDMKAFGEFVYVIADEGEDGLLIIDMSEAPNNITWEFWKPQLEMGNVSGVLRRCHNIFIDEDGYGYLAGCRLNSGGPIILDLFSNPGTPELIGASDPRYAHDVMTRGDLMFASDLGRGFSVIDISDRSDPVTLASQSTTMNFTHNAWSSDDNNYIFTTDERANSYVDSYDISDLNDIRRLDSFRPGTSIGSGSIPHNTHYHNGYLVTSWYTDGVRIIDGNKPDNLVEVAYFDTFLQNGGGFSGAWGATPYLPSGLVLVSDIGTGLYVFDTEYVRAAYLEGNVTDQATGLPLGDVAVTIESTQVNNKETNSLGDYKTGIAAGGEVTVTFNRLGYEPAIETVTITNGEVTILDVELIPLASYSVTGTVRSAVDNAPIANAGVLFQGPNGEEEVATDANGEFIINSILEGEYQIFAGAWGYENILFNPSATLAQDESFDILLNTALMDDFIVDMGWTTESQAETGDWVRVVPIGTFADEGASNPSADTEGDIGNKAYVTGNSDGGVGDTDIDGGTVILRSPMMDLTQFVNPRLSYDLWFFNGGGGSAPNDNAIVRISNGVTDVDIEVLDSGQSNGAWRETFSFDVAEVLELTTTMQFSVLASDDDPGHLSEAGLDRFLVEEAPLSANDLVENDIIEIAPNPFSEVAILNFDSDVSGLLTVTNVIGQVIETIELDNATQISIGSQYNAGTYFITLETRDDKYEALRIIKQ